MPARKGDITKSIANISKIKSIGFKPDWSLEKGLKAYWEYENNK
jgi:UDP-glucose 4-epimerase